MGIKFLILVHIISLFTFTSCRVFKKKPINLDNSTNILLQNDWKLENSSITLEFDRNNYYGFGGCNNYSGKWLETDGVLQLLNLTTTKKACHGKIEEESSFLYYLQQVNRYEILSGVLHLYRDKLLLFKFQKF